MALLNKDTRKQEWLKAIYNDYPNLKGDTLKEHFVETMVDSYLADEASFKKITNEAKKNNTPLFKENSVSEIVAIKKVDEPNASQEPTLLPQPTIREIVDAE